MKAGDSSPSTLSFPRFTGGMVSAAVMAMVCLLATMCPATADGFTEIGTNLVGLTHSSVSWGDYDSDGDLDIVMCGRDSSFALRTVIYRNDGDSGFVIQQTSLPDAAEAPVVFGDYDGDDFLDISLNGTLLATANGIYRNEGSNNFRLTTPLFGAWGGSAVWGDFDQDADIDLFWVSGFTTTMPTIHLNTKGSFVQGYVYPYWSWSPVVAYAPDFDGDGRLDLVIAPMCLNFVCTTRVLRNLGQGSAFEEVRNSLPTSGWGIERWADHDNDGSLDILLTGENGVILYRNLGAGSFAATNIVTAGLERLSNLWGNFDQNGDGRLDVWVYGVFSNTGPQLRLFTNAVEGYLDSGISLSSINWETAAWGDYDNDGDLDIVGVGDSDDRGRIARIYRNETVIKNAIPTVPSGLSSGVTNDSVTLFWAASDDSNQIGGLSYNIRIGTVPGRGDVSPAMANPITGWRRVAQRGNAGSRLSARFENLPSGVRYYWSVQAIDNAFAGSPFPPDASFYIQAPPFVSEVSNQVIRYSSSTGPLAFTIGDLETPAEQLSLTATSSDTNLVQQGGIQFAGEGANRTITVTPVPLQLGTALITIVVSDAEEKSATNVFSISVTNAGPTISKQNNLRVKAGEALPSVRFQVGDEDSDADFLEVAATFSNSNLLQRIDFSGGGNNRIATLDVDPTKRGITTITITVRDAVGATASDVFTLEIFGFELMDLGIPAVQLGALDLGDFDNDGDLDVLLCGQTRTHARITGIFENNEGQAFRNLPARILGFTSGGLAWGDYDSDGDLDLAYAGFGTRIHRNEFSESFPEVTTNLQSFTSAKVVWADYDNDGDLDLVASGAQNGGAAVVRVFQNLGRGILTNVDLKLPNELGAIAWGDYDNDGDLDLAAAGVGKVFRNDGAGVFAETETSLEAVSNGSIAWGDFDNDGWQDLLLCGARSFVRFTLLYRNNGKGGFTQVATQIPDVTTGQASWGDYDNDGHIDILLTGSASQGLARIYRNNSDGTFSNVGENWLGVSLSAGVWGDFDGDGDLDVLYTGRSDAPDSGAEAIMLRNLVSKSNTKPEPPNGLAVLSDQVLAWGPGSDEQTTNASGLTYNLRIGSSPGASDVLSPHSGADGTRRVAKFGNTGSARKWRADLPYGTYYCSVQAVDGAFAGSAFTEETLLVVTNLRPTISSIPNTTVFINKVAEIAFEVEDNESPAFQLNLTASSSSPDLVPSENIYFSGSGSKRTINILPATNAIGIVSVSINVLDDGGLSRSTSFRLTVTNPAPVISGIPDQSVPLPRAAGPIPFTIWDQDSTPETLTVTAQSSNPELIPVETIVFEGTGTNRSVSFSAAKTDPSTSTITVTVTDIYGKSSSTTFLATVELFTLVSGNLVENTRGTVAWGDMDNDHDLDLLVSGQHTPQLGGSYPLVYGNASGKFELIWSLPGSYADCAIAWGDYNNDGWLDFANIGRDFGGGIYPNNKDGTFLGWGVGGIVHSGSVAWGDADDDGDLDLLMTGATGTPGNRTELYVNKNGFLNGETIAAGFPTLRYGSGSWSDYDNDGDQDILLTGLALNLRDPRDIGTNTGITRLYRHDIGGKFIDTMVSLPGTYQSAVAWADFNNDGWTDFVMSGYYSTNPITKLFRNNSDGTFSEIASSLPAVHAGSLAWADWNADGFADLLITGTTDGSSSGALTRVYRNNHGSSFSDIQAGLPGVYGGSAQWGDYDNDGDLDIALCGTSFPAIPTRIYRNNSSHRNNVVPVPGGLTSAVVSNRLAMLSWAPTNIAGISNGLTYNLRVGRTPSGDEVVASHSAPDGYRRLPASGNCGLATSRQLRLAPGTYYWSVQTVTGGYLGSSFAPEQTFTLTNMPPIVAELLGRSDFVIRIAGEPFQQCVIEVSDDMSFWGETGRIQLSSTGSGAWTNQLSASDRQFFRVNFVNE